MKLILLFGVFFTSSFSFGQLFWNDIYLGDTLRFRFDCSYHIYKINGQDTMSSWRYEIQYDKLGRIKTIGSNVLWLRKKEFVYNDRGKIHMVTVIDESTDTAYVRKYFYDEKDRVVEIEILSDNKLYGVIQVVWQNGWPISASTKSYNNGSLISSTNISYHITQINDTTQIRETYNDLRDTDDVSSDSTVYEYLLCDRSICVKNLRQNDLLLYEMGDEGLIEKMTTVKRGTRQSISLLQRDKTSIEGTLIIIDEKGKVDSCIKCKR